jgi:hypothetical protein
MKNALMAGYGMRGFYQPPPDDPGEIPPEGFVEGDDGPPDQYTPQDEMQRNPLMAPLHRVAARSGGRQSRSDMVFEIESKLREMAAMPQYQTDEGILQIMGLAHQQGVRSPYDRAFNEPPAARGGPLGPSGKPRPLMRGPDEYQDERGGRGAFWDDNDPSVYESEYQARYGRR